MDILPGRAVTVAQLVERLLPKPDVRSSNTIWIFISSLSTLLVPILPRYCGDNKEKKYIINKNIRLWELVHLLTINRAFLLYSQWSLSFYIWYLLNFFKDHFWRLFLCFCLFFTVNRKSIISRYKNCWWPDSNLCPLVLEASPLPTLPPPLLILIIILISKLFNMKINTTSSLLGSFGKRQTWGLGFESGMLLPLDGKQKRGSRLTMTKKEREFQGGLSHPPSLKIPIGSHRPNLSKNKFV